MNYELKSIKPGSVFINALRTLLAIGFLVAFLGTYVLNSVPQMESASAVMKLMLTILFAVLYDVVFASVLALIAVLYNFWAANSKGITVHFEQE